MISANALPAPARYAAAVIITVLANVVLAPLIGVEYPFLLLIAAVLCSAWFFGFGPGLCATVTGLISNATFHFTPIHAVVGSNVGFAIRVVIFAAEGFVISAFCESIRRNRERVDAALSGAEKRTMSTEERARLTRLEAEIGKLLAQPVSQKEMLDGCVRSLVEHGEAAFARIWTYNESEKMLELQVSAGLYTHTDGPHGRVPLGQFKIGLIASERKPHLTNEVIGDERVNNQEWAQREKMVAFAGYPLLVGDKLYGVLAMFSRKKLPDATLSALALVAHGIALSIQQRESETQRTLLLREAEAAREAAERANRAKDEFIATVSHELRTPLNAILGWAHLLENGDLDKAEIAEASAVIERNARSQSQLIEDLLDVSRIISGKLRLDLRAIDLPEVVEQAVKTIKPTATVKAIRLDCTLDPRAGPVSGDADRLQQIAWNLLSNAVKFTPKGGRVQVRLSRSGSFVELCVSDTGIGIPEEFLPRVFERFTQADSSSTRTHSGLGLGLGITRHLVELHGGTVHAHSDGLDQGATFIVRLPIIILHRREDAATGEHPRVSTNSSRDHCEELEGVSIVAVDDDADARRLLHAVMTRCKAKITVVATVQEALAAVQQIRPDVLISDIEMPVENGYDLLRQIRALAPAQGGQTPAVALTAYARMEDRTRALRAGFQMHVPKPVEPAELIAVVANLALRSGSTSARPAIET